MSCAPQSARPLCLCPCLWLPFAHLCPPEPGPPWLCRHFAPPIFANTNSLLRPLRRGRQTAPTSIIDSLLSLGFSCHQIAGADRKIQTRQHRIPVEIGLYALRARAAFVLLRGNQVQ